LAISLFPAEEFRDREGAITGTRGRSAPRSINIPVEAAVLAAGFCFAGGTPATTESLTGKRKRREDFHLSALTD